MAVIRDPHGCSSFVFRGALGSRPRVLFFLFLFPHGQNTVKTTWLDDRIAGLVSNRGCSN